MSTRVTLLPVKSNMEIILWFQGYCLCLCSRKFLFCISSELTDLSYIKSIKTSLVNI